MSRGNRQHAACDRVWAVGGGEQAADGANRLRRVHLAGNRRFCAGFPVVRHDPVAHRVASASVGGKLPRYRARRHLHQAVVAGAALQNVAVGQPLMNLAHVALPQRGGGAGAGGFRRQRLVVVMPNPQGGGVVARHAGEENAFLVGVRAGFARDGLPLDCRVCARAGRNRLLEHVHHHVRRGFAEHAVTLLLLVAVPDDLARAVRDAEDGNGLLIHAAVRQHAEGNRHLHGRNAAGAEGQAERRCVNVRIVNAHRVQEGNGIVHAHKGHQRLRGGGVVAVDERLAQRLRAGVGAAAVVARPRILPV